MANQIIDYGIAAAEDHFQLAQMVNDQRKDGYQPFNSAFQYTYGEQLLLCQPMVKYGVIKKKPAAKPRAKK